jgi:hypothetical protein
VYFATRARVLLDEDFFTGSEIAWVCAVILSSQ